MEEIDMSMERDYAALDRFTFERSPVGIKFLPTKPQGVRRLSKDLNMCEMIKEAQTTGEAFFVGQEDFHCVEPMLLGMVDPEPVLVSGLFGQRVELYKEARACSAQYQYLPKLLKGSVKYVVFSPIDKISFDPDVLVIVATIPQAQTLLRSINYSTGEMIASKLTPVLACAWLYVYPVVSGEMNYAVTGLSLGMSALDVYPPGLIIMSVPWAKLPTMLENLKDMPVGRSGPPPGGEVHRNRVDKLMEDLRKEIEE
jgi:uncharacterized protein (DUF169 family)